MICVKKQIIKEKNSINRLFLFMCGVAFQKMYTFCQIVKKMHTLNINTGLTKRNRLVRRKLTFLAIATINKKEKIEKCE